MSEQKKSTIAGKVKDETKRVIEGQVTDRTPKQEEDKKSK